MNLLQSPFIKSRVIRYHIGSVYFIDDHCQYWLNKADGTLISPNFGINDFGEYQRYDHNLNCTWIFNADYGFYITIEIEYFHVNNNDDTNIGPSLLLY